MSSNDNNNNNNNMNQGNNNFWDFVASLQNNPGNTANAFPFAAENRAAGEEAAFFDPFQGYQQFWGGAPWQQQHRGGRRGGPHGHGHRGPHHAPPQPATEEGNDGADTPRGGFHEHHGPPPPHHHDHRDGRGGMRHEHEHHRATPPHPSVEDEKDHPSRSPSPPTPPETPAEPHHHPRSHSGHRHPRGGPHAHHRHGGPPHGGSHSHGPAAHGGPPHHGPGHHGPPHLHRHANRRGPHHHRGRGRGPHQHTDFPRGNTSNPFDLTALASAFAPALFGGSSNPFLAPFLSNNNNNNTAAANATAANGNVRGSDDATFTPAIDLRATKSAYTLFASLPGAKKSDVSITYSATRHSINISGVIEHPSSVNTKTTTTTSTAASTEKHSEKQKQNTEKAIAKEKEQEEEKSYFLTNEINTLGWFEREIQLETGVEIDEEAMTARLEDGVLRVLVPKIVVEESEEEEEEEEGENEEEGWESVRRVELV